jgi:hypothetical protein
VKNKLQMPKHEKKLQNLNYNSQELLPRGSLHLITHHTKHKTVLTLVGY